MTVTTILRGGIGNCLFGICSVLSYSMKHNCDYLIPTKIENPHSPNQTVFYSRNIKYGDIEVSKVERLETYTEPFFHYQEIPKFDCDVLILNGYFQSWKFFDEYREEILKILDIPYEFKKDWCSIQVRRGDYLTLQNIHPVITSEYLVNAIAVIFNKTSCKNFLIFGDDVEWNKAYFRNIFAYDDKEKIEINFDFSENKSDIEDLVLASSCEHNIGSNSSYSWWIYYLNENRNKIGVFTKKWFGKDLPHDTKDLIMPKMILL